MVSSHCSNYAPGHDLSQVKHHEWRTAENSAAYLLPQLQKKAEEMPKLKFLDVGAGSGTITASFAKYMPEGHIIATDISDDILTRAKFYAAEKGCKNISFQKANVYELPFSDAFFDVVHAHQVLCHLDAPSDAVREMVRVTKPGGIIGLRESDMRMWCIWPELPSLLQFHALMVETLVANGGQDKGGRRLVSWVVQAGVARKDVTASFGTWCYSDPDDRETWSEAMIERLRSGQMRTKAIELGIASDEDIDDMIEAWKEWSTTVDATLGLVNGEVVVIKAQL